jgi:hypothetical protein
MNVSTCPDYCRCLPTYDIDVSFFHIRWNKENIIRYTITKNDELTIAYHYDNDNGKLKFHFNIQSTAETASKYYCALYIDTSVYIDIEPIICYDGLNEFDFEYKCNENAKLFIGVYLNYSERYNKF